MRVWRDGSRAFFAIAIAVLTSAQAPTQDTEQQMTVLHLSQTAERSVVRDVLRIELRVEETGADARSVQAAINRRMAAALEASRQISPTDAAGQGAARPRSSPGPLLRRARRPGPPSPSR